MFSLADCDRREKKRFQNKDGGQDVVFEDDQI